MRYPVNSHSGSNVKYMHAARDCTTVHDDVHDLTVRYGRDAPTIRTSFRSCPRGSDAAMGKAPSSRTTGHRSDAMQFGTTDAPHASRPRHRVEQEDDRAWLHDTVLQVLEYLATGGFGSCTDAQRLMQVAARAADDLREVIDGSELTDIPTSFVDGLSTVVEEARELSGIDVRLELTGPVDEIDPIVGGEIVAVVREALNNARKHSGARIAFVECDADVERVEVRVVDDGHGFDPLTVREGLGIRCSMRQRMARCGGSIAIASAPGRGVVVRITSGMTNPRMTESVA